MEEKRQTLVLIDGNAILHRAYHALPPLTNRSGELVNAVYGFTTMLLKVIDDLKPDCLAVAFDVGKPTFRQMEYLGYQAKRPQMDEGLIGQIEKVHEVVKIFGIPIYAVEGFEADDVIGTIAKKALPGREVIIVTGDRDIMQLVEPRVKVYLPVKGLSEAEMIDEAKVKERVGVKPSQIIDYKALAGDQSDNYPGVPGIGPKTAVELLTTYQTLEKIYQNLGDLPENLAKKLREGQDLALLSQKLARILTEVPLKVDFGACRFVFTDKERKRVSVKLGGMGFKSLASRLAKNLLIEEKKEEEANQLKLV